MQSFRIRKSKPRTSKPKRNETARLHKVADSISTKENEAMISYIKYIQRGVMCYYDRAQSIKYTKYLRHRRGCDGTFSLEEFRKIGE